MTEHEGTLFLKHTQVVVHWADGRQESFRLGEVTRIGRGRNGNDIAIPEVFQSVSRQHLEIRHEKDGYRLIDLNSRNGVSVNGVLVSDTFLRDGNEISIGQHEQEIRIRFQLGNEAALQKIKIEEQVTLSPAVGLLSDAPHQKPHFKIRWQNGATNYYPIWKDRIVIGRGPEADLRVPDSLRFVSGQHAEVIHMDTGFVIRDLNSANGTLLNNQPLQPDQFHPLGHESIIRIGDEELGASIGITFFNPLAPSQSVNGFLQAASATQLNKVHMVLIGRIPTSDIALDHPEVSRRHALVREADGKYYIEDLDSSNGTYVNDQRVKRAELNEGDLIQISKFLLLFQGGRLTPFQSNGMRLDLCDLSMEVKTKNEKHLVLDHVNLTIMPRELVAIICDDAGKSALIDILLGTQSGNGEIRLNGHDFFRQYKSLRLQIGYVAQASILPHSLTVEKALDYTTRIRLPASLTSDERMTRIDTALDAVAMNTRNIRLTCVGDLSNEQRKRVHLAAELIADPKLIILDEPAADLDPGMEKRLMHTLRRLADEGRTVIVITRAANNTAQTDQVAFLSEGKLVYFGPAEESLNFFEVEEFANIYEHLQGKSQEWRKVFEEQKPENYRKYVQDRQKNLSASKRALPAIHFGITDFFTQAISLTQRSLTILARERKRLTIMLLLLPAIAILQLFLARNDILTGNPSILANPVAAAGTLTTSYMPFSQTNAFIFMIGLGAVIAGLFLPFRDIRSERVLFAHERMGNLNVPSYLFSKTLLYGGFTFIQVLLYLIIMSFGVDFPAKGIFMSGAIEYFITLILTLAAGVSLGFLISASSKSTETAITAILIVLLFQIFFSGTMIDLRESPLHGLSYFVPVRWSLTALGSTSHMDKIAESTILCNQDAVCFSYSNAKDELRLSYGNAQLLVSWFVLIVVATLSLAVTGFMLRRNIPT